jgi:uncharacterized protein YxeA
MRKFLIFVFLILFVSPLLASEVYFKPVIDYGTTSDFLKNKPSGTKQTSNGLGVTAQILSGNENFKYGFELGYINLCKYSVAKTVVDQSYVKITYDKYGNYTGSEVVPTKTHQESEDINYTGFPILFTTQTRIYKKLNLDTSVGVTVVRSIQATGMKLSNTDTGFTFSIGPALVVNKWEFYLKYSSIAIEGTSIGRTSIGIGVML